MHETQKTYIRQLETVGDAATRPKPALRSGQAVAFGLKETIMNVKTMLSLKGNHVITIEPHATLEAAGPWSCWARINA